MQRVQAYVDSPEYIKDSQYWCNPAWKEIPEIPLSKGKIGHDNSFKTTKSITLELDRQSTAELNLLVKKLGADSIVNVLTFAVSQVLTSYMGSDYAQLMLIGSGRLVLQKLTGIDTSNIIGWLALTSVIRVPRVEPQPDKSASFKKFHSMTSKALGDGFLWDLMQLRKAQPPTGEFHTIKNDQKVVFNYLGEVDAGLTGADFSGQLTEVHNAFGLKELESNDRALCFRISTLIRHGKLQLRWEYSESFHSEIDIDRLAREFMSILLDLVAEKSESRKPFPK
jgi:non-ribosomal peptide synthase protein (TIGR01720 family)